MSTGGYCKRDARSQAGFPGTARFAVPISRARAEPGVPGPVAKPALRKPGCCHPQWGADPGCGSKSPVRSALTSRHQRCDVPDR